MSFLKKFILCLIMLPSLGIAQELSVNDIIVDKDMVYDKSYQPLTGTVKYGLDRQKHPHVDSALLCGLSTSYRTNSDPYAIVPFTNGRKNGTCRHYENNTVSKEFNYKNGYLDGEALEYDDYHPGELREKTIWNMNRCVQNYLYRDGIAYMGFRAKQVETEPRVSKITGQPIYVPPLKDPENCRFDNSIKEQYSKDGKVVMDEDAQIGTKKIYYPNGAVYIIIQPASQYQRSKNNLLYKAYYQNGQMMLNIHVKNKKAISGEFYNQDGEKTILDEQKANDYLMDLAFTLAIGAK